MSFQTFCSCCGAPSSPSVGICPYCKSVMSSSKAPSDPSIEQFNKLYEQGHVEHALNFGTALLKSKPELKSDLSFLLNYVRVLFETEAPESRIRTLLTEAQLTAPGNPEVLEYMELLEAKGCLREGHDDPGEKMLKNIIRRSPKNAMAYFLLGAHFFWTEHEPTAAIPPLETCVRLQPHFLRAWGCLGAIYQKVGNLPLAQMAFQKCSELETDPEMKEFFLQQLQSLQRAA